LFFDVIVQFPFGGSPSSLLQSNSKLLPLLHRHHDTYNISHVATRRQHQSVSQSINQSDVISAVSEPAHLVAHQRTQHSIVVRPTDVRAISTDIIRQTIVQHCRTSDLELTATCCVKTATLSLLSNPNLKSIYYLLLSVNYSTYLFRQRLCSRSTALRRFIKFVLLLILFIIINNQSIH